MPTRFRGSAPRVEPIASGAPSLRLQSSRMSRIGTVTRPRREVDTGRSVSPTISRDLYVSDTLTSRSTARKIIPVIDRLAKIVRTSNVRCAVGSDSHEEYPRDRVFAIVGRHTIERLRSCGFAVVPLRPTQEMKEVGAPSCFIVPDGSMAAAARDAGECYSAMVELGCL